MSLEMVTLIRILVIFAIVGLVIAGLGGLGWYFKSRSSAVVPKQPDWASTVADVKIDERGGYKFIVARVTDGKGGEKLVVRAEASCAYHRDILAILRQEVRSVGLNAECVGGGRISISPERKSISISGSSGDFGVEPNRYNTVRMLQVAFPEFRVTGDGGR